MFDEEYTSWARREHSNALLEVQRLESLMEDVSWYQFEIAAKGWQTPWHTSFPGSVVELYSQVYIDLGFREIGTFPVYYYGPVDSAPPGPPREPPAHPPKDRACFARGDLGGNPRGGTSTLHA